MPGQQTVKTHFVLERDEFAEATKLALRNLPLQVKWAVWVQCGLLFAIVLMGVTYRPNGELQPFSLITLLLVWLVLLAGKAVQRSLESLQFTRMQDREIWYEFEQSGFRCGMPDSESRLDWSGITRSVETNKLLVLIQSGVLFYTIPKRALAAEEIASLT